MTTPGHLRIGALVFDGMDQCDFTGPFEVLSRTPDSEFIIVSHLGTPVKDVQGLLITPTASFDSAPDLDVLVVPGGVGVDAEMEDAATISFVRRQVLSARLVIPVCTGAFLLGAAGLLTGRRVTTHWASHHLLVHFGAIPIDERVVVDGNFVSAAGVTSGIDAALQAVAILRGRPAAEAIQLYMEYAPAPPFTSGSPKTAPPEVRAAVSASFQSRVDVRGVITRRVAKHLAEGHHE